MMKRVILALAAAAFMLPLAAQTASGKWSVELGAWFMQPRDVQINYATEYNWDTLAYMNNYYNGPERRWSPEITLAYETPTWKTWLNYYHYDKTANTMAAATPGQSALSANYLNSTFFLFFGANAAAGGGGTIDAGPGPATVLATSATASTRLNETSWSWNIGRKFHPSKNWEMLVYTGVRRFEVALDNNLAYTDAYGFDFPPTNSTAVAMQSYSTGWGLNFGLINSFKANDYLRFNAGAGLGMLSMKEEASYLQTFIFPDGSGMITDQEYASETTISPAFRIFLESQVNFSENWFAKIGYRYEMIRDVFNRSLTPDNSMTSLYFGKSAPNPSRHLAEEGLYASVGFSW
ncbi:MAG: hypothetical protein P8Z49_03220 [Acidobacteriota bacterium]|jgi:hypothetical protein